MIESNKSNDPSKGVGWRQRGGFGFKSRALISRYIGKRFYYVFISSFLISYY
jgi:hypothetical protein